MAENKAYLNPKTKMQYIAAYQYLDVVAFVFFFFLLYFLYFHLVILPVKHPLSQGNVQSL